MMIGPYGSPSKENHIFNYNFWMNLFYGWMFFIEWNLTMMDRLFFWLKMGDMISSFTSFM
jgi:hypothetical protein